MRTLDAVCRRVVPCAYDGTGVARDVASLVALRVARVSGSALAALSVVLRLFGSASAAMATVARPRPFADLPDELQDRILARWSSAPVPFARTAFQGLRR